MRYMREGSRSASELQWLRRDNDDKARETRRANLKLAQKDVHLERVREIENSESRAKFGVMSLHDVGGSVEYECECRLAKQVIGGSL